MQLVHEELSEYDPRGHTQDGAENNFTVTRRASTKMARTIILNEYIIDIRSEITTDVLYVTHRPSKTVSVSVSVSVSVGHFLSLFLFRVVLFRMATACFCFCFGSVSVSVLFLFLSVSVSVSVCLSLLFVVCCFQF